MSRLRLCLWAMPYCHACLHEIGRTLAAIVHTSLLIESNYSAIISCKVRLSRFVMHMCLLPPPNSGVHKYRLLCPLALCYFCWCFPSIFVSANCRASQNTTSWVRNKLGLPTVLSICSYINSDHMAHAVPRLLSSCQLHCLLLHCKGLTVTSFTCEPSIKYSPYLFN